MLRNIDKNENNNFINDYIEYHFQKETKKFSKLKYNLTNTTSKKLSKIKSYNTIESTNKQIFPCININQNQMNSNSKKSNNYYSSIKISKRILSKNNLDENVNALSNIKKDEVNIDNDNAIKRQSISKKSNKKIIENLKNELDKELIINEKNNDEGIIKSRNKKIKKNRTEIKIERALREKEEEKIIDILYIGNNIINNCKIKNKIIYDIRPLNKTKERGTIHFLSENDSKPTSEIQSNTNTNTNSNTITNTNNNTIKSNQKSLKYFRKSYSQFYSTYSDFNKNIPLKIDEDKEKVKITKNYKLSEKDLIDLLKIDKEEENKNDIKIEINPEIKNNKKKLEKIKSFNSINNTKYNSNERKKDKNKNNLDYIDLGVLAKELSDNDKKKNNLRLRSFFDKEENVIRGEKIKFLKTCHQVKLVKPLLSQHTFKFKNMNGAKKINVFSPKSIKYPPNHFNLDIIKESNMKKINNTKNHLIGLKSNINKYLTNLVNHLEKEIKYK